MVETALDRPLNTAIVVGSARQERLADKLLDWLLGALVEFPGLEPRVLDPRALAVTPWHGDMDHDALGRLREGLAQADGCLVLTPEYNHSFPGALKSLIDAGKDEWARKPVGFISYGGISGGLRAVEQLRLVFAELRSHTLRDTVSFANPRAHLDEHGAFCPPAASAEALRTQVHDYFWWGRILRAGRC